MELVGLLGPNPILCGMRRRPITRQLYAGNACLQNTEQLSATVCTVSFYGESFLVRCVTLPNRRRVLGRLAARST